MKYQAELKSKIEKLKDEIKFRETKFSQIPPPPVKFENKNNNCSNCQEIQQIIEKKDAELKMVTEKSNNPDVGDNEFVKETAKKIQELSANFEQKTLDLKDSLAMSEVKCEKYELKLAEVVKSYMNEVQKFSTEYAECQSQIAELQSEKINWILNKSSPNSEDENSVKPKSDSKKVSDAEDASDVLTDVIITKDAEIEAFKQENSYFISENVRMKIKLDALLIETDALKKNYEKFML